MEKKKHNGKEFELVKLWFIIFAFVYASQIYSFKLFAFNNQLKNQTDSIILDFS